MKEMNPKDFNYDFKGKVTSITSQHMPTYEKDLVKITQDDPNINQVDTLGKYLNLSTSNTISICTQLLADYHKELMKFLESR